MSNSQTLEDLKKTGVKLSQAEAQEIHTRIGDIAKGIHESGELFEVVEHPEMGRANDVKATNGFTPLSEDLSFLGDSDRLLIIENDPDNTFDESLNLNEDKDLAPKEDRLKEFDNLARSSENAAVVELTESESAATELTEDQKANIENHFASINDGISHENVVKAAEIAIANALEVAKKPEIAKGIVKAPTKPKAAKEPKAKTVKPKAKA